MSQVVKSILLIVNLILLAGCGTVTPEPVSTAAEAGALSTMRVTPTSTVPQTPTAVPSLMPVGPTSTSTQTATRTTSPTAPASTSTPALPTSSATPQPDSVEQTREAEEFCYQDPRKALDDYLTFLYQGEYEKAARLYGSTYPYEGEFALSEDLDPAERLSIYAQYLEEFCWGYGTCLEHRIVVEEILSDRRGFGERIQNLPEGDVMIFGVNLFYENGEIFEAVPPAGVPGERHTLIGFIIARLDGCYKSIDIPPMTP